MELGKRIQGLVRFLCDSGGATYLEKPPADPNGIDFIAVDPALLPSLLQFPNMKNFKLNPLISFCKGIDYLENCCKFKQMMALTPYEKLLPNGGVIVVSHDILLEQEDVLNKIVALLEKNKIGEEEWSVKIHKITERAVNNFVSSSEMYVYVTVI